MIRMKMAKTLEECTLRMKVGKTETERKITHSTQGYATEALFVWAVCVHNVSVAQVLWRRLSGPLHNAVTSRVIIVEYS